LEELKRRYPHIPQKRLSYLVSSLHLRFSFSVTLEDKGLYVRNFGLAQFLFVSYSDTSDSVPRVLIWPAPVDAL